MAYTYFAMYVNADKKVISERTVGRSISQAQQCIDNLIRNQELPLGTKTVFLYRNHEFLSAIDVAQEREL